MKTCVLSILMLILCPSYGQDMSSVASVSSASNSIDFSWLADCVAGKRIVALGESSHGVGEFYALKSELVQYLHKELGYELLIMEGGFGSINLAWQAVDDLSAAELRDKTLFGNFKCRELSPMFDYIKASASSAAPLHYAGMDVQLSGSVYDAKLQEICELVGLELDVEEAFNAFYKMYQTAFEPDSTYFILHRNNFQQAIIQLQNVLVENKDLIQDELELSTIEFEILNRNLANQYAVVDFNHADRLNAENIYRGMVLRDAIMADNVRWLVDELYPGKKAIIWGHNAHTQKGGLNGSSTKWTGQLLKDKFGDDYCSIGLFAYKGKAYQHWTKKAIDFENAEETFLESILKNDQYQFTFQRLDLSDESSKDDWMRSIVKGLEMENGGAVEFIPAERFDAVINLYEVGAPNFNTDKHVGKKED